jgi:hypothetical protein
MDSWTKVVTEPLGLAGFALFLMFVYLGKVIKDEKRRWLSPVAFACAAVTLIAGFSLAYLQLRKQVVPQFTTRPVVTAAQPTPAAQQSSSGPGSPNVQGVDGDVTITVDQSTGKTIEKKADNNKATH